MINCKCSVLVHSLTQTFAYLAVSQIPPSYSFIYIVHCKMLELEINVDDEIEIEIEIESEMEPNTHHLTRVIYIDISPQ